MIVLRLRVFSLIVASAAAWVCSFSTCLSSMAWFAGRDLLAGLLALVSATCTCMGLTGFCVHAVLVFLAVLEISRIKALGLQELLGPFLGVDAVSRIQDRRRPSGWIVWSWMARSTSGTEPCASISNSAFSSSGTSGSSSSHS
jgi:hypothetical protein